ncbi:MAG: MBL fold metallo-hydrolase [Pseudomonadota bacterium]
MRLDHLRLLEPAPGILAWYDGRIAGLRAFEGPNWVDDGALSLGIAAYAVCAGRRALVYDSHISVPHGARMRADLEARGFFDIAVLLSHHHLDHIAGTAAFEGCEILAGALTAQHLARDKPAIEAGTLSGPPAIDPLILPDRVLEGTSRFDLDGRDLEILPFEIHSGDGMLVWLAEARILLAGDALEDPITYVAEPDRLATHLDELDRLAALRPERILPNHGDPARIASGGYGPGLIDATRRYTAWLAGLPGDPGRAAQPLHAILGPDLDAGHIHWFAAYEAVHRGNIDKVLGRG